ncbi:MAG: RNA polymerase sigma factor [Halopseudomonas sp.]
MNVKGMDESNKQLVEAMVALQPRLRRFAYGLAGSMDDADELVQCTYERALPRLDQWQVGTRLDSWLYRILQNIWFNQLRAKRVRGEHLPHADTDDLGCDRQQRQTEASMMLDRVRSCIQFLPEDQRAPLLLVSVEGLSYKEAAEVLDVPMGTLTSRLSRGRLALLQLMEKPASTADLTQVGVSSRDGSGVAI